MIPQWVVTVAPFLLACGVSAGTYLQIRRKSGGTIRTSEADDLWIESRAIRSELRSELEQVRLQATRDREALFQVQSELEACRSARVALVAEYESLALKLREIEGENPNGKSNGK